MPGVVAILSLGMVELWDIVGQPAVIAQLARTLAGQRRPHAYIFAGPEGVGRRTTAEALAKLLLCEAPAIRRNAGRVPEAPEDMELTQACGQCAGCRAFSAGTHADYQLVYKELARYSNDQSVRSRVMQDLGIDVVREFLIAPANRRGSLGRGKVFVVRQAELMSVAAQNALLKTLEEPPPGVTIILICPSPEELLPTTRSRCSLVRFGPLPVDFVTDKVIAAGIEPAQARFWAAYTAGSVGVSLRMAAKGVYATKRELVDRLAALAQSADPELGEWLAGQAETLADGFTSEDAQLARSLATRQAAGMMLGLIGSVYRDAMALSAGASGEIIHSDQYDAIARIAQRMGANTSAEIVTQLARYEQLLWSNVNPKVVWDNLVITCATGAPLDV